MKILTFLYENSFINENRSRKCKKFVHGRIFYIIHVFFQLQTNVFALQLDNFMKQSVLNKGLAAAVTLPIFFLRSQQARTAAAAFP